MLKSEAADEVYWRLVQLAWDVEHARSSERRAKLFDSLFTGAPSSIELFAAFAEQRAALDEKFCCEKTAPVTGAKLSAASHHGLLARVAGRVHSYAQVGFEVLPNAHTATSLLSESWAARQHSPRDRRNAELLVCLDDFAKQMRSAIDGFLVELVDGDRLLTGLNMERNAAAVQNFPAAVAADPAEVLREQQLALIEDKSAFVYEALTLLAKAQSARRELSAFNGVGGCRWDETKPARERGPGYQRARKTLAEMAKCGLIEAVGPGESRRGCYRILPDGLRHAEELGLR